MSGEGRARVAAPQGKLMKQSRKPVRNCHSCPMNLGDHCWLYRWPRGQWRGDRSCSAREDEAALGAFHDWQKAPDVMTRKDLRRELHRQRRATRESEGRDWLAKRRRS